MLLHSITQWPAHLVQFAHRAGKGGMNTENLLILVLVIVLLVLVVMFVRNNRENFRNQVINLYIFVVDWCPHCTRAKPEVAKLKNNLSNSGNKVNNKNVRVNLVNAEENKDLVESITLMLTQHVY